MCNACGPHRRAAGVHLVIFAVINSRRSCPEAAPPTLPSAQGLAGHSRVQCLRIVERFRALRERRRVGGIGCAKGGRRTIGEAGDAPVVVPLARERTATAIAGSHARQAGGVLRVSCPRAGSKRLPEAIEFFGWGNPVTVSTSGLGAGVVGDLRCFDAGAAFAFALCADAFHARRRMRGTSGEKEKRR